MSKIFKEPKPQYTPHISFCDKNQWQPLLKDADVSSKACFSFNKKMTWAEKSIMKMRTK